MILEKHGFWSSVVPGEITISHHFHGKASSAHEAEDAWAWLIGGSLHVIDWEGASAGCCYHGVSSCCFQNVRLVLPQ